MKNVNVWYSYSASPGVKAEIRTEIQSIFESLFKTDGLIQVRS